MKTLFFFLYTFGLTIGVVLLNAQHLEFGAVAAALAVAVMFAMALNDSPRALRPLPRPAMVHFPARPVRSGDLAA